MNRIKEITLSEKDNLLEFAQRLIQITSYTGMERDLAICVKEEMVKLGYDQIIEDSLGNVLGIIGNGKQKIMLDSHMDTVVVNDAEEWSSLPFGGEIIDGKLYGRGAVDMKSALAAMVYSGYIAKKANVLEDKTIYISSSVMEEDFEGYALGSMIDELDLKPDCVIICEPTEGKVAVGHRGRALLSISTYGVSCHGSTPQNGKNAIYEMRKIIERIEHLSDFLMNQDGEKGSVALSRIESDSVSLNAVPNMAKIYLDRRLAKNENLEVIRREMDSIIDGTNASWEVCVTEGLSYTDKKVLMNNFMEAWEIPVTSSLAKTLNQTYKEQFSKEAEFFKWDFSTNGFASTSRGIPTIGYGPGEIKYCHMIDEHCKVEEIINASAFYAGIMKNM